MPNELAVSTFMLDSRAVPLFAAEGIVKPALVKTAAAMRVADVDELGDRVAIEAAQRVGAGTVRAMVREIAIGAKLLGIHIDDGVAGQHQRIGIGDVAQIRKAASN